MNQLVSLASGRERRLLQALHQKCLFVAFHGFHKQHLFSIKSGEKEDIRALNKDLLTENNISRKKLTPSQG